MAIYRACKTLLTGSAIAASLLLTVGCSRSNYSADTARSASIASARPNAPAMPHGETSMGASNGDAARQSGTKESGAEKRKGVSTSHDVFHSKTLEVPAGTTVPGLSIDVESDPVRGWNLYVGTANFTFEPSKINGESLPTEGHAQLYINDKPMQRIYSTWTHLPELPPGTNEVRVTLNASGHETITTQGEPIEDSVTVEVYDPNAATN